MEEILKLLNQTNNETELFEALLIATIEPEKIAESALTIASRIQAGRDIRFDLQKIESEGNKQGNKRGLRNEVSGKTETKN